MTAGVAVAVGSGARLRVGVGVAWPTCGSCGEPLSRTIARSAPNTAARPPPAPAKITAGRRQTGTRREPAALDPGPNPRAEVARWRDVTQAAHDPPLFGECGERRAALAAGVEMGIQPLTLGVRQLAR